MRREPLPTLFGQEVTSIHCVGVGGMGVGPLAIYLAQLGFRVSGEDDALTEEMRRQLERAGVAITETGAVPVECQLVASSSAIASTHPASVAARARRLPQVRRGELLAEVTRGKRLVAVCGSHGKTTTTAMLVTTLRSANFPAGYVLGGLFADDAFPPARAGSNDWVVAEIDESDGTIERFSPVLTVAVNLDWDHPDHYRRPEDSEAAFRALFERTRDTVLVSDACGSSQRMAGAVTTLTFGRTGDFVGVLQKETPERTWVGLAGRFIPRSAIVRAHGEFNVANATAALAAAQLMGATISEQALAEYPGVRRRQSVLLSEDGMVAIEDYAHHPAEIRALLGSLRRRLAYVGASLAHDPGVANVAGPATTNQGRAPGAPLRSSVRSTEPGRLVVAFQPHRFSRTAQFKTEFAAALALADRVHLIDVYGAGEPPIAGGTTADLYAELTRNAPQVPVVYLPGDRAGFQRSLHQAVRPGDLVAFVGAGDIDREARIWVASQRQLRLEAKRWDDLVIELKAEVAPATLVRREEPLAARTTMRVGGAARIYCEPVDALDLGLAVRFARARSISIHLLGRGSNLLIPDEGVNGIVVCLVQPAWQTFEPRPNGRVWVGAGLRLKALCGQASKAGLAGFEFLEGIPGSVGGALRMNAGAMGAWIFDVVEEVRMMTLEGEIRTLARAEMHVDYRHCAELHDAIALGALLKPAAVSEADVIKRTIDVYRDKRHTTQPRDPSAGCIFKNPPNDSAGRLIDAAGLKGERVGDAEVSPVHANFIVNRGQATSAEVIALIRQVRARVRQASGVTLEPEVLLYGQEWKDVL